MLAGEQSDPRIGHWVRKKHADTGLLFTAELAIAGQNEEGVGLGAYSGHILASA